MIRTLGVGLLALAWGIVVFVVGVHMNFPGDALVARARYEFQSATDGSWDFTAADAGLWRMSGVALDDAVVFAADGKPTKKRKMRRRKNADGEQPEEEPEDQAAMKPVIGFDRVGVRAQILPLLKGDTMVDFDIDLYGGNAEGSAGQGEGWRKLALAAADIDLSRVPFEGSNWSIDAAGKGKLDADFHINTKTFRESEGELVLAIDGFGIRKAEIMSFPLDPMAFTTAVIELAIEDGKARVTNGRFTSDVLDATLSGDISLASGDMSRWRMRIKAAITFSETYDSMLRMMPGVKDARDTDGTYHFLCTGPLSSPRCREDRAGAGNVRTTKREGRARVVEGDEDDELETPRTRRKREAGGAEGADGAEETDADEAERAERRKERLERVRERRKRLREEREEKLARGELDEDFDPFAGRRNNQVEEGDEFDEEELQLDEYDENLNPGLGIPDEVGPFGEE